MADYEPPRSEPWLAAEGLPVSEFPQSASRMTPATQRMSDMVNTRSLTHDGDPRLARHVSNAVLKQDSRGTRLMKETKNSPRKIDLAVAAVMGLERAMNQEPAVVEPVPFVIF
jgi:phage terminase large subunit-like protein